MKRIALFAIPLLSTAVLLTVLPSCEERKGPAEEIGEAIDDAANNRPGEKVRDAVEDAADKVEDAINN